MDDSNEQPPAPDPLGQSTAIPIAQISPEFDRLAESSICATVTLVWPYSSSTKTFSFLLAEPDFRFRRSKGQVKVVFHEIAAEKVAKTQVGIGDEVVLSLAGSRLEKNEAAAQTPSRYVAWDVHLDDRVHLETSRSSQHYSTVKIDPPVEPVQHAEVEPEPPVTPIVTRTRPEETEATACLSSWASPAFFQRSRASLGTIVDTRLDPFAEEDGFVPGKGRKRPRFSMKSSEWRVVNEPASPGEKASPADWTEELENESLEPEVDGEGTTEDIATPQEVSNIEAPLPEAKGISSDRTVEDTTVPTNQLVPGISFGIERPVKPDATKSGEAARQVNEKAELTNGLHRPIDTPRLLPIPSPCLPVPSPFVSGPDTQQDYFASAAATQTRTTTGLSQTTKIEDVVSEVRPGDLQTETAAVPGPERIDEGISTAVSESITGTDVLQNTTPTFTAGTTEPMPADSIKLEEQEERVDEDDMSASLDREASAEEEAHIKDNASDSSGDIKMEGNEGSVDVERISSGEDDEYDLVENEEEVSEQEEASDEEDEQGEIKSEEEAEEGEKSANQVINVQDDLAQAVERGAGRMAETVDIKEEPDEAAADESDSAQPQAETYSEPEEGYDVEDEDKVHQDEEMYDEDHHEEVEEYESEHRYEDGKEEFVNSELELDEESDEQPYQAQAPLKSAQPEVIVLDSDDEDEQPDSKTHMQMPIQPKREGFEVSDDQESYEENREKQEAEGWISGEEEEVEDEVIADGRSDERQDYSQDEYEDDYDQDEEEQAENAELVEDEQPEDRHEMVERTDQGEQVENEPASDDQEQGSLEEEEDYEQEEDEEEDVDVAISTKHATTTHLDTDKELHVDTHVFEETHATEDLARHSEQDIHEHDASTAQDVPSGLAVDPTLYQFQASAEDTVSNEKQGTVDQLSQVLIEHAPKETQADQGADSGLLYDGAVSPRVIHESLPLPPDSLVDQQTVTLDSSQETGRIQQVSGEHIASERPVTPEQTEEWHEPSQLQAELSAKSDDALDLFGTREEDPRFGSFSIPQQERVEINERATHQNSPAQGVLDESESQLQDGLRDRDGFSEESELYVEALAVPDRQYPGLRSKLSYFAPLATLIDHFHTLVDTISIVHDSSSIYQAASSKKDYTLTLHLTDPSLAGTTITAQLFRPYKEALPSVSEGNAILLRNFTVKSFNHSMTLASVDTSAWAVFSDHKPDNEAEITGPPVEYGNEEHTHATDLRQWYQEDGAAMIADNQLQTSLQMASESREVTPIDSVATSDSGLDSVGRDGRRDLSRSLRRSRKSHRRITIHELRDGRRYTEVGSPSDRESIHELRDGTVYANL